MPSHPRSALPRRGLTAQEGQAGTRESRRAQRPASRHRRRPVDPRAHTPDRGSQAAASGAARSQCPRDQAGVAAQVPGEAWEPVPLTPSTSICTSPGSIMEERLGTLPRTSWSRPPCSNVPPLSERRSDRHHLCQGTKPPDATPTDTSSEARAGHTGLAGVTRDQQQQPRVMTLHLPHRWPPYQPNTGEKDARCGGYLRLARTGFISRIRQNTSGATESPASGKSLRGH